MRSRRVFVGLTAAALAVAVGIAPASSSEADVGARIMAVGGTPFSNGIFTPGTAVYDGREVVGVPVTIDKGQNFEFINLDEGTVANGHKIVSLKYTKRTKKRRPRPLFQSKLLRAPGDTDVVKTSHLPRGTYEFSCPVHTAMFGILEIQ